ncbi:hypothetical protein D3C81_1098530 [compost metagenome]
MQDVARVDRQQCHRAAQQHREQVQRDRTQQHRPAADIGKAGEHRTHADRRGQPLRGLAQRDAADQHRGDDEQRRAQRIHHAGTRHVGKAADGRADDDRGLAGGAGQRHRARQLARRHHAGQQCLQRGVLERARGADQRDEHKDVMAVDPAGEAGHRHAGRQQRLDRLAGAHDAAPVEAVGDVAGHQDQHHRRQELHQPDHAQHQRITRQVVHLPAHRHGKDLVTDGGAQTGEPVAAERGVAEDAIRLGGRDGGRGRHECGRRGQTARGRHSDTCGNCRSMATAQSHDFTVTAELVHTHACVVLQRPGGGALLPHFVLQMYQS